MPPQDVPRPRADSTDSVLAATVSEGRLWRKSSRTLRVIDRGLAWGNDAVRAVIPWAAIRDVRLVEDELVVEYAWPYVNDGDAVMRFALSPMLGYLFHEEIRRRIDLQPMRAGLPG